LAIFLHCSKKTADLEETIKQWHELKAYNVWRNTHTRQLHPLSFCRRGFLKNILRD